MNRFNLYFLLIVLLFNIILPVYSNQEDIEYTPTEEEIQQLLEAGIAAQEQPLPNQLFNITAKDIYSNSYQSAYISEKGELYHWGLLSNVVTEVPEIIKVDENKIVEKVSLGGHFLLIKTKDGLLYSMGRGQYGVLGVGDSKVDNYITDKPQLIKYFKELDDINIIDIVSGFEHSMVSTNKGIYTFGRTNKGQLGIGNIYKVEPREEEDLIDYISTPQLITGVSFESDKLKKICSGSEHNLVLTKDNKIYSWGNGYYGSLGHGDNKHLDSPKEIEFISKLNKEIVDIACGGYHSMALTGDGELYSWGWAELGQLGLSSNITDNQLLPTKVSSLSNILLPDEKIESIYAGAYATSFILSNKGNLYSFGWGESGSLGLGDSRNQYQPIIVPIPSTIVSVSAGFKHTLAKDTSGNIFAFGDDTYSQTGTKQNVNFKQAIFDMDGTTHHNNIVQEQIKALL